MVIPVTSTAPVLVDTDAVIGWTASLEASIHDPRGSSHSSRVGPLPAAKGKGVADTIGELLG
jgi:hypothetical protein